MQLELVNQFSFVTVNLLNCNQQQILETSYTQSYRQYIIVNVIAITNRSEQILESELNEELVVADHEFAPWNCFYIILTPLFFSEPSTIDQYDSELNPGP